MWAIFEKALYDARRTILWLSIGLGIYALFAASFFPSISQQSESYNDLLDAMPEGLTGLIGVEGDTLDLASPIGYLSVEFMTWSVLILAAVVMVQAFNAVTNAERDGTMDVLLAFPISRRDVLLGRFLNTVATLVIVQTVIFVTLLISTQLWEELAISVSDLLVMVYGSLLILLPYATFTYALTTIVPSSKRWAGAIAYSLFFGMYLVYGISGTSDALSNIRPYLLFDYYNATRLAREGLEITDMALMVTLTVIFAGVAWWRIDEKELGV